MKLFAANDLMMSHGEILFVLIVCTLTMIFALRGQG